jgi:hypothetical protein
MKKETRGYLLTVATFVFLSHLVTKLGEGYDISVAVGYAIAAGLFWTAIAAVVLLVRNLFRSRSRMHS